MENFEEGTFEIPPKKISFTYEKTDDRDNPPHGDPEVLSSTKAKASDPESMLDCIISSNSLSSFNGKIFSSFNG